MDNPRKHDKPFLVRLDVDGPVHQRAVGEQQRGAPLRRGLVEELGVRMVRDILLQIVVGEVESVASREDSGAAVAGAHVREIEDQSKDLRMEPSVLADRPVLVPGHPAVPSQNGGFGTPVEADGDLVETKRPAQQFRGNPQYARLGQYRQVDGIQPQHVLDLQAFQVQVARRGPSPVRPPHRPVPEVHVFFRRRRRRDLDVAGRIQDFRLQSVG